MHWIALVTAIVLEVSGTTCMKLSDGFNKLGYTVALFLFYAASLSALTWSLKQIEVSVAYAVWSGVGTALIAVIGMTYFREPLTAMKLVSLALIIAGVVGLNLSGSNH